MFSVVAKTTPEGVIWRDFNLLILGVRVVPRTVKVVEVYAVRLDGSIVRHLPVAEDGDALFHKAESVFQVLGPGNMIRLRVFTNVRNTLLSKWPKEHNRVHRVPGMVLVVLRGEEGTQHTRHVFVCPEDLGFIWATDEAAPRPTQPRLPVGPRKKRARRR